MRGIDEPWNEDQWDEEDEGDELQPECLGQYGWGSGYGYAAEEGIDACGCCPKRMECLGALEAVNPSKEEKQIAYRINFDAGMEAGQGESGEETERRSVGSVGVAEDQRAEPEEMWFFDYQREAA